jgi:hypothetical protein
MRLSPCASSQRSSAGRPASAQAAWVRLGGSSIASSVSLNVPQWIGTMTDRRECGGPFAAVISWNARIASSGFMCAGFMNHLGSYAPTGSKYRSKGP